MSKNVLIIGAHPDDEILGVGGTARRHVLAGDAVHALIICEGVTMRYTGTDMQQKNQGRRAAEFGANRMRRAPRGGR